MILDVLIPVFHEEENISKTLNLLNQDLKTPANFLICYDYEEDPTLIEIKKDENLSIAEIRNQLSELNIGDIQIQTFGSDDIILIRIENSKI